MMVLHPFPMLTQLSAYDVSVNLCILIHCLNCDLQDAPWLSVQ